MEVELQQDTPGTAPKSDISFPEMDSKTLEEQVAEPLETMSATLITQTEDSRKRSLEDELQPVLVRLPSKDPSCSSDYICINKNTFKIGRKPDNNEVILSVWISRNHCVLNWDGDTGNWLITNLSSTDTLLNDQSIERNKTQVIKEGDILQLSLSDGFRYKFTMIKKQSELIKHPRLESDKYDMNSVLNEQKSFVECQENERKDLEKQLATKQQEQEDLRQELEKLLQDQKITKTCNEELNTEIVELQRKIEVGNTSELALQQQYRDLLGKLEEERLKFEEKLAEEKQRWQEALRESKQEKEQLEMSMVEQMEELREKLEKKQQEEWQKKIDHLLVEEKNVQTRLLDEKQLLEQKLREMEEAMKARELEREQERERDRQQEANRQKQRELEQQQAQQRELALQRQNGLILVPRVPGVNNCILLKVTDPKNARSLPPVLETIDLTGGEGSCSTPTPTPTNPQENVMIDRVNHIMDENLTCSICSELFYRAITLNCTHTFCRHCIETWMKKRRECPNCRAAITSKTQSLAIDNFIENMVKLTPEQKEKRDQLEKERTVVPQVPYRGKIIKIIRGKRR